jgi:hypothetical protein
MRSQAVLGADLQQVRNARHGAVVVHDLADHGGRGQAREGGEVDRRLGLAGALEHAALPGAQGKDMAGAQQVLGAGRRVDGGQDGGGAVGGRDAGGGLAARLDRDREGGAERGGVVLDHQGELQLLAAVVGEGEADQAAPVAGHEVDRLGGDLVGRDGEVALVLAVLVVDDDDDPPLAELDDRLLDGSEGGVGGHGDLASEAVPPGVEGSQADDSGTRQSNRRTAAGSNGRAKRV